MSPIVTDILTAAPASGENAAPAEIGTVPVGATCAAKYRFTPKRVLFEQASLDYDLGRTLWEKFSREDIEVAIIKSHNRVTAIPGKTSQEAYAEAKRTLVVGVKKSVSFESCKPSAHFQLPLATSCPGMCEYCYLQTTLGKKPYIRVYVNIDEILDRALKYIEERKPEVTQFEGAATSDPLPLEPYTGSLAKTIEFFGRQEYGRFRFVTKFTGVEPLLLVPHNGHTRFRFSVNSASVISKYEHRTPTMSERAEAAGKVAAAGYPLGFIIAPVFFFPGWESEYRQLLQVLKESLGETAGRFAPTFEVITHRFTARAKRNILELFPETNLPMDEESERVYKYGQFGYGKFVYDKTRMAEIKAFFTDELARVFKEAELEYFI